MRVLQPPSKELVEFVREALAHGWPDNCRPREDEQFPTFYETHYRRGSWRYLDLWGGSTTDIGIQVVFWEEAPVWGFTYRGGITTEEFLQSDAIEANPVFSFLVEALRRGADPGLPIRGPRLHASEDRFWTYSFQHSGTVEAFLATERIRHVGQVVYERLLIGGRFGDGAPYGDPVPAIGKFFGSGQDEVR